jgi:hypothetical protein
MITVFGKLSLRIQIYMCCNAKWMAAFLDVGSFLFSTMEIWHPETMFVIFLLHFGCNSTFSYSAVESNYGYFRFLYIIHLQYMTQEDLTKHCMLLPNGREVNL